MDKKIAFVGGGNMAEAVCAGLIRNHTVEPKEILVSEIKPERRAYLEQTYSVETTGDNTSTPKRARTIFLAVKPQMLKEVKDDLREGLTDSHLVISILAGQSRKRLGEALDRPERIVRVMPNLPAQVGRGISAITFPETLNAAERDWVRAILQSVGEIVEVEEPLQDVVTAVSGSGPGYIFFLAEHFIAAAVEQGLPEATARRLVTETLAGSAELLKHRPDSPAELVGKVATPGGTTEAGLSALREKGWTDAVHEMVRRATARSRELNQS